MEQLKTIEEWLGYIKTLHFKEMDRSLERVAKVAERLGVLNFTFPVVTIGGTNGKGSTTRGLESIYLAAGYRVGTFTTPYLFKFNEIVRVQGQEIEDDLFVQAFQRIESARREITLTPFEFNTLAALDIFQRSNLDICFLEVGLGGRLDAVNIVDADLSIVTSIAIDHAEILGESLEEIGREKAGIFRPQKAAIFGGKNPPQSLLNYAKEINAFLFIQNQHFGFEKKITTWNWWNAGNFFLDLPLPSLALANMSCVLMAVDLLQSQLFVSEDAIKKGMENVFLPGRIQVIPGKIPHIFDVSHNPAAASWLADYLREKKIGGKTYAVFSMLKDKDIFSTLQIMRSVIDRWFIAPLQVERAASLELLQNNFLKAEINHVEEFSSMQNAYEDAAKIAGKEDRLVIFGSFYTVAALQEFYLHELRLHFENSTMQFNIVYS